MSGDGFAEQDPARIERISEIVGIRIAVPPSLPQPTFHRRQYSTLMLVSAREDWEEMLVIHRYVGRSDGDAAATWEAESLRLADGEQWTDVRVSHAPAAAVNGAPGHTGWIRFTDALDQRCAGLLWMGQVGDDAVSVGYWCREDRLEWFFDASRRLFDSIRWSPVRG